MSINGALIEITSKEGHIKEDLFSLLMFKYIIKTKTTRK
jgi:hypothetical protein